MKVVRDRPEARLLPARHHFALARLIAFLLPHRAENPEGVHVALAIDPNQSVIEATIVSAWITITVTCYLAAVLPLNLLVAILVALPLSSLVLQLICEIVGVPLGDGDHTRLNSVMIMLVLAVASAYFVAQPAWVRLVACFYFLVVIANGIAAAILWLLRGRVRELEARCGA